jgi:hypothetical protein
MVLLLWASILQMVLSINAQLRAAAVACSLNKTSTHILNMKDISSIKKSLNSLVTFLTDRDVENALDLSVEDVAPNLCVCCPPVFDIPAPCSMNLARGPWRWNRGIVLAVRVLRLMCVY